MAETGGRSRSRSPKSSAASAGSSSDMANPVARAIANLGQAPTCKLEEMLEDIVSLHCEIEARRKELTEIAAQEVAESQADVPDSQCTTICGSQHEDDLDPPEDLAERHADIDSEEADVCEKLAKVIAGWNSKVQPGPYTACIKNDMNEIVADLKIRESFLRCSREELRLILCAPAVSLSSCM